jgi:hypothetical protein
MTAILEPKPETAEVWHKRMMEVSWTEDGKMFLRHELRDGSRISYPIEIDPHMAEQMARYKDA